MNEAVVGVLALQGDYAEHRRALERIGAASREVRRADELGGLRALVLPGGESTTMLKFIEEEGLLEPLRRLYHEGAAMFGTCAGVILLAKHVTSPCQPSLGLLDVSIERNGYGRQIDSHESREACPELGDEPLPMVFIRAPVIRGFGPGVRVLAHHRGEPVLVREERILASTFHPELTDDPRVHRYFLESVAELTVVGRRV
ncbi:MAG TPA: pyridoxal 5'-phosphate synthase glutaminase subunit PdxT [Vicinamibacteria bacterium]|nr:pyridoxal 5'-phosphate synthase glutaminase subunit PdxT [Vicinamibacteria bacterium]